MRSSHLLLLLVGLIGLWACEEERLAPEDVDRGLSYFPLELGNTWTYAVDSIIYDFGQSGTVIDSSRTYTKLVVVDELSAFGQAAFSVDRYWRASLNDPWQIHSVIQLSQDEEGAYWTEDNLRFVKMQWPLNDRQSWDGNRLFDEELIFSVAGEEIQLFKNWEYEVKNRDTSLVLGNLAFEDVIRIEEASDVNLIEYRSANSYYAKNVGLVWREWYLLDTQCEECCNLDFALCESLPWREKSEVGFILREQLIDFE